MSNRNSMFSRFLSPPTIAFADDVSVQNDSDFEPNYHHNGLALKALIDKLLQEGISLNVNLPQLVVIGSQSSGKSSLFEGITRLGLPRSSGTCTRCPIFCRGTKRGTTWRCRIGLKYEFQVSGERLPHPRLETFGEDIFDPYDVPERISRAQAAILRPDVDWRNFLEPGQYETSSDFSFNSVTVEIEGPEVEDLTFVDLPGIIAADPEGQPGLKERVRGMALEYVQKEESLILLVYQCDQDDLTQGAVELAKECDPQGNRTIVVLTKPDLPTLRSTAQVLMAPWKQRFRESENWFVVRQPDGNYINQFDPNAWGVAREEEEIFFREKWQEEWNDQSLQSRLGTKNLRNYLVQRLLQWNLDLLPNLYQHISSQLRETEKDLRSLPSPRKDPVRDMDRLLDSFDRVIDKAIDIDKFKNPSLLKKCRSRLDTFVETHVYHLYPRLVPFSNSDGQQHQSPYQEFHATSADIPDRNPKTKLPRIVYLEEVIEKSKEQGRELPDEIPYGIVKDFLEESVKIWHEETASMLEDIYRYISDELEALVATHFADFKDSGLVLLVQDVVQRHIDFLRDEVEQALSASQERDDYNSLVFNKGEYRHLRAEYQKHYMAQSQSRSNGHTFVRNLRRIASDPTIDIIGRAAPVVGAGVAFVKTLDQHMEESRTQRRVSTEEKSAIQIMSKVRAFYHIVARQYAESAASLVLHDLLLDLRRSRDLYHKLCDGVGMRDPDNVQRCYEFIDLSKRTNEKYKRLEYRKSILQEFLDGTRELRRV